MRLFRLPVLNSLVERSQKRSVTGISEVQIELLDQEIAEGFQLGIPQAASGFGKVFGQAFQELVDLVWSNGVKGTVSEPGFKPL